jgi:hypothetical protein
VAAATAARPAGLAPLGQRAGAEPGSSLAAPRPEAALGEAALGLDGSLRGESGETLSVATVNIRGWGSHSHQADAAAMIEELSSLGVLVLTETKRVPARTELSEQRLRCVRL